MTWQPPGEKAVARSVLLHDASAARNAAQRWARENEANVAAGVWISRTDGSRRDVGQVGAAGVFTHSDEWRTRHSYLGIGRMEVFETELWAIGLALEETVEKIEFLPRNWVTLVAVFSDLQAAIRWVAHLETGPGHQLARGIIRKARAYPGQHHQSGDSFGSGTLRYPWERR
jgi:hypothetical protein